MRALRIGDDVEVTVMAVNGSQVRIGIKAPRNVAVDREEIAERKQREREPRSAAAREPALRIALNLARIRRVVITARIDAASGTQ